MTVDWLNVGEGTEECRNPTERLRKTGRWKDVFKGHIITFYSLGTPETDRFKNKMKQGHVTVDKSGILR